MLIFGNVCAGETRKGYTAVMPDIFPYDRNGRKIRQIAGINFYGGKLGAHVIMAPADPPCACNWTARIQGETRQNAMCENHAEPQFAAVLLQDRFRHSFLFRCAPIPPFRLLFIFCCGRLGVACVAKGFFLVHAACAERTPKRILLSPKGEGERPTREKALQWHPGNAEVRGPWQQLKNAARDQS